jgi:hypothetical protein
VLAQLMIDGLQQSEDSFRLRDNRREHQHDRAGNDPKANRVDQENGEGAMSAKRPDALHLSTSGVRMSATIPAKTKSRSHIEDMNAAPSNIQIIARMMASHTSALTDRVSHSR